jgi:TRAP-type C4-dicarboxylate transport system, periplasmic component
VREFEVFDLPYIFDGYDALNKITQGAVGQQLMAKLEPKGIRGLAFWDNGFKSFSANTPIRNPRTCAARRCASSRPRFWKSRCARSSRCRR